MNIQKKPRVMWLLNHGTARKFEIAMLKKIGLTEIFLPKKYPNDPYFRSASVDYLEDANLTIPQNKLELLNTTDWYGSPSRKAWDIANEYFDILFFILHNPEILKSIAKHYQGIVLWRIYGLQLPLTYDKSLQYLTKNQGKIYIKSLRNRLHFAEAYNHLHYAEPDYLSKRAIYLPLGLQDYQSNHPWRGEIKKILFVCPDIGFNDFYKAIYKKFIQDFKGFNYVIGGAQPIPINDPHVLGFVSREIHEKNMQSFRVMFYHSTEPNHIHYHPFEAIREGMPLVFMAGGILDKFGGRNLPGRCKTIEEAKNKIALILNDDWRLIEDIRKSQMQLLEPMKPENCINAWREGFQHILDDIEKMKITQQLVTSNKNPRIAIILPISYRGGSLRGTKLLAHAIEIGASQSGQKIEVVLGHLDDPDSYPEEEFADLPPSIKCRPFNWKILDHDEACRAMTYAGLERSLEANSYIVPNDGIQQFMDCDLWIIVSDRLSYPLLPIRPYILMIYDYLQRYEHFLPQATHQTFINSAHHAEQVFVTTEFTRQDAIQFAGIAASKVKKLPMLAPVFSLIDTTITKKELPSYFIWTTNLAPHKNHENAFKALRLYYEKYNGLLECHVTGVDTKDIFKRDISHLKMLREIRLASPLLKAHLKLRGELPDQHYQTTLAGSTFLWHAGRIDNGTFSVIEAVYLGVPALSSDYPAMREIDEQFRLNLSWMDAHAPENMAAQLKYMEENADILRKTLSSKEHLKNQSIKKLASAYWEAVRECL